jgi:hypothetical protein
LNPYNDIPLTEDELTQDCLCYLTFSGNPVKASRIFSGNEHEQQVKRLADHFSCHVNAYQQVSLDMDMLQSLHENASDLNSPHEGIGLKASSFSCRDLNDFNSYEEAYHRLIMDIVAVQVESSMMVLQGTPVRRLFVDGGFSHNRIFMHLLAEALPQLEIFAASVAQATSLGAALALHSCWNTKPVSSNLIELKYFANSRTVSLS